MTEAFIYDAVRTPRGKGKKDGSLHQVTPIHLVANLLWALQARNKNLDTSLVDDLVLGCVTPVGEQGADIARVAAIYANWAETVAGVTQSRFCASGLESVNIAAQKVMSGMEDLVVAGGVESMSRWAMGSDGGAWAMDPRVNQFTGFAPQGIGADTIATLEGFSRQDVDAFALNSQKKATIARDAGYFAKSLIPVKDLNGMVVLDHDEYIRSDATMEGLGALKASFEQMGQMGFDATALRKYTTLEKINHVHHAQQLGHRRWRRTDADRQQEDRQEAGPDAARTHRADRSDRFRTDDHAHRHRPCVEEGAEARRHERQQH